MTTAYKPINFRWTGQVMQPVEGGTAAAQFEVGESYRMQVAPDRSIETHRHYFAAIQQAWNNLPEDLFEAYPTPEHLRKNTLVALGYCDRRVIVADTVRDANTIAASIEEIDCFAIVTITGCTVTVYTAKSQNYRSMDAREFQQSKDAVLDSLAAAIGVSRTALEASVKDTA